MGWERRKGAMRQNRLVFWKSWFGVWHIDTKTHTYIRCVNAENTECVHSFSHYFRMGKAAEPLIVNDITVKEIYIRILYAVFVLIFNQIENFFSPLQSIQIQLVIDIQWAIRSNTLVN